MNALLIAAAAAIGIFWYTNKDKVSGSSKWEALPNANPLLPAALDTYAYTFDQAKKAGSVGGIAVKFKARKGNTTRDVLGAVQDIRIVDGKRLWRVLSLDKDAYGTVITDPAAGSEFVLFDNNLFA